MQEQETQVSALERLQYDDEDDWFFALLPTFMFVSIPGYAILQTIAVKRFSGGWRWAGMAPLLVIGPAALHAAFALAAGTNRRPAHARSVSDQRPGAAAARADRDDHGRA